VGRLPVSALPRRRRPASQDLLPVRNQRRRLCRKVTSEVTLRTGHPGWSQGTLALRLFPCWHANTDAELVATLCLSAAKERNSLRDELFTGLSCGSLQEISKFRPLSIGSVLLVLREKSCRGVGAGRAEAPGRRDTLSSVVSALHPRLPVAFYCRRTEVRRKKTYDHGRIPNNVTAAVHQHARRGIEFHELDPEE